MSPKGRLDLILFILSGAFDFVPAGRRPNPWEFPFAFPSEKAFGRAAKRILSSLLVVAVSGLALPRAMACSTILAGKQATADGSVLMSHSCDGDVMGLVYVMPARSYPPGTRLPMYWNVSRPTTYEEYQANLRKGYDQVGTLPVSETCRSLILAGNLESMTTGGLNEHGVSIAIEFLPMRKGLAESPVFRNNFDIDAAIQTWANTTTQDDISRGIVNIHVGFRESRRRRTTPAEGLPLMPPHKVLSS
jgi:hypothetical protein